MIIIIVWGAAGFDVFCILYFEILFILKRHIVIQMVCWLPGLLYFVVVFLNILYFEEASGDYFCMGAAGFAAADGENRF